MAGDTKDVELRIRAILDGKKSLTETVDALKALASAQDDQLKAAKRGEVSAKSLQKSYEDLAKVAESLLGKSALTRDFDLQAKTLDEVRQRLDAARTAQSTFARSIEGVTKLTKAQSAEQARVNREVKAAEGAQINAENRLASLARRLEDYGISANGVAGAQDQIRQALEQTTQALVRQDAALKTVDADMARAKAEAADLARAEKASADAWDAALAKTAAWEKSMADFQGAMRAQKEKELAATREQIEAEAKFREALKQTADAAAARARGTASLARPQTTTAQSNLAGAIQTTVNPGSVTTLQSVEAAVAGIERRAATAIGPVRNYTQAMRDMEAANRALVTVARQVDAFQNQVQAVRNARTEYVKAREAVAALVTQMRAGTAGASLANDLTSAQAKLAAAAREMSTQTTRAREMREGLRAAGVATNDLAAVQTTLTQQAARSAAASNTLATAVRRYGTDARGAALEGESLGRTFARLTDGERTTLSFFQRLRGEVLGFTTAFVGINAAIDLAKGSLEVVLTNQRILNGLTAVFDGNSERARVEFEYLKQASLTLGVNFDTAAKGYAKFAIGAKTAGFTIEETRFVFERLSLAARNAGLSNEEYEGTLKAVEQMMSKGVIQAEELKGQLGDRLPGAVGLLAQSMGKTIPELLKMMEQGGVVSQYVLNLARQAGETFGKTTAGAAADLQKAINDQDNAARAFKEALAESGFVQAYTQFLTELAAVLRSPEGKKFAQELSALFGAVTDVMRVLINNLDLVKIGFEVLIGIGALAWFNKVVLSLRALAATAGVAGVSMSSIATAVGSAATAMGLGTGAATAMSGAVGLLGTAVKFLARAIPFLGAALIALDIGEAIYNRWKASAGKIKGEADALKKYVDGKMAENPLGQSSMIKAKPSNGLTPEDGIRFVSSDQQQAAAIEAALKKNQTKLDTKDKNSRAQGAKAELEERIRIATEEQQQLRQLAQDNIKDEKLRADTLAKIDKQINFIRITETRNFNREQEKSGESAAAKRLRLAMDLAQQLDNLANKNADKEAQIDPNATFADRLDARKKLAADAYDEIEKKIKALDDLLAKDPKATAAVNKRLSDSGIQGGLPGARALLGKQRDAAVDTAAKEAAQKEIDRLEKRLSERQGLLTAKLEAEQKIYESGAQTQEQLLANRASITKQYNDEIAKSADDLQTFATTYKGLLDPTAYDLLITRIKTIRAGLNSDRTALEEQLTAQEGKTNRVLDERKRLLDEIKAQLDANLITDVEAASRTNAINAQYKDRINGNINATLQMVEALRKLNLPPEVLANLDATASKLRIAQAEINATQREFSKLEKTIQDSVASGISSGLNGMVDGVAKVAFGIDKSRSVWGAFRDEGLKALADVTASIAQYIIKLQVANALAASTNPSVQAIGVAMGGTKPVAQAAGAAAAPAGDALTKAAEAAAATQTAAATTAAATQTAAATAAAATDVTAATAAATVEQTSAAATATTDVAAATTAAGVEQASATVAATAVNTGAATAASQLAAAGTYVAGVLQAAAAAQAATAAFHTGGVVGGGAVMSRTVSPAVFATAQRFHKGGVPGLSRNEVPAVLMKGEEVITRDDPRHVLNGGKSGGGAAPAAAGQRFVLVDDRTKVAEAMATPEGEEVTMVHVRRNIASLKALLRN